MVLRSLVLVCGVQVWSLYVWWGGLWCFFAYDFKFGGFWGCRIHGFRVDGFIGFKICCLRFSVLGFLGCIGSVLCFLGWWVHGFKVDGILVLKSWFELVGAKVLGFYGWNLMFWGSWRTFFGFKIEGCGISLFLFSSCKFYVLCSSVWGFNAYGFRVYVLGY